MGWLKNDTSWSCSECGGSQHHKSGCLMITDKKPMEHWTKEPPTVPGWYKVVRNGKCEYYRVSDQGAAGLYFGNNIEGVPMKYYKSRGITYWWSEPEGLPALPEECE